MVPKSKSPLVLSFALLGPGRPRPAGGLGPVPAAAAHAQRHAEVHRGRARQEGHLPHLRPEGRRGLRRRRLRPGRQDDQGRPGRLVAHRRPADARLLQLHLHRRRRPHRRPEERDDQAGRLQPGEHVPRPGRRGRVRGDEGRARTARSAPSGIARARSTCPRRMHVYTPARLRGRRREVPGPLPAARRRRRGLGLEHDRPRRVHPRQPDRREEGGADDRGHAQRQPAAAEGHARPPGPRRGPLARVPGRDGEAARTASPTSC